MPPPTRRPSSPRPSARRVIRNRRNEGYGRANNIGAREATSEFLLFVNPDVVVEPGSVAALLTAARRYPEAGFFAPRIIEPTGRVFFQPRSLLAPYLSNPRGSWPAGRGGLRAVLLRSLFPHPPRDLFLHLGGFDEQIFLFYEDDDLCRRVADTSPALIYVPRAVAPWAGTLDRHEAGTASSRPGGIRPGPGPMSAANTGCLIPPRSCSPSMPPRRWVPCLTGRRALIERYGGSVAGAWAFIRGRTALGQESLDEEVEA